MRKQSEAAFDGATLALPELSATATEFVHQHPEEARVAVTAALEAVAAHFDSVRDASRVTDALRTFVVEASGEDDELIGAEEAARRLVVSRATVYNWIESRRLLGWRLTRQGTLIPAEQILGPGELVAGIDRVLEILPEPRAAWRFLKEESPFLILHSVRSMRSRPARSMTSWRLRGPRAKLSHDCPIPARAGEGSLAAAFSGHSTSHCVETLSVRSSDRPSLEIPVLRWSDVCRALCRWRLCHGIR